MTASMRRIVRGNSKHGPVLRRARTPKRRGKRSLFRTLWTGIDGTDEEVAQRPRGSPNRSSTMVLGHEAVAEVVAAAPGSTLRRGTTVVPLVRHGCGSCPQCKADHADLCTSRDYLEHGIRGLDGFMQDLWTDDASTVVPVPRSLGPWAVLVEPMSIIAKGWQQAAHVQARLPWSRNEFQPSRALIVGAGSLAAMAALFLSDRDVATTVLDRHAERAASSRLWRRLDITHVRSGSSDERSPANSGFDLIFETTGVPEVALQALETLGSNGVLVLLGIPARPEGQTPLPSKVLRHMVLMNQAVVGSVNSNRAHFEEAIQTLRRIRRRDAALFDLVVTHRFEPAQARRAFATSGNDVVKKIIEWNGHR
jgi:glucose 1-dehydrogenase